MTAPKSVDPAGVLRCSKCDGLEQGQVYAAEPNFSAAALAMLAPGGRYDVVGYGGTLTIPTVQLVLGELQVAGSLVGTADDLAALVRLAADGQVTVRTALYPLDAANEAISDLEQGRVRGRAILTPGAAA